jgi:superfamily II DNA or RNA helicase
MKSITPLRWQSQAVDKAHELIRSGTREMFISAGTSAGKTLAGLFIFKSIKADRLLVITPKTGIRGSWAKDAELLGLSYKVIGARKDLEMPFDVLIGNVQGVKGKLASLIEFCKRHKVMLAVDEAQHYGEDQYWRELVQAIAKHAHFCIGLSATPMRSDQRRVLFMPYSAIGARTSKATPHIDYPYHEAVADGLAAPVVCRFVGGVIEREHANGRRDIYDFSDGDYAQLTGVPNDSKMSQRLRAATVDSIDFQMAMVERARSTLMAFREDGRPWAGLIVCKTIDQAHEVAAEIAKRWSDPLRVVVGEVDTQDAVTEFEKDDHLVWVVSITKVSEGVSINRLRVGVHLAPVTAPGFLDQERGRLARLFAGVSQIEKTSALFLPADPRLIAWATNRARLMLKAAPWLSGGATAFDSYLETVANVAGLSSVIVERNKGEQSIDALRVDLKGKPKVLDAGRFTLRAKAWMAGAVLDEEFIDEAAFAAIRDQIGKVVGQMVSAKASREMVKLLARAF